MLVAKRHLLVNTVPAQPGGGTVRYVNEQSHRYIEDPATREEGGTPAIIESIRAGLVFQLKEAVGAEAIREREVDFIDRAITSWSGNPNIGILGNKRAWRLSIVSFVVRHGGVAGNTKPYLHHNFVVALLNDLFGIQRAAGARAPVRTAIACSASISTPAASSSARSRAAARASSRVGCASTSTTS